MPPSGKHFSYKNGILTADNIPIADIIRKTGTPVYIYSSTALLEPLREFQRHLRDMHHTICFAVKANSNISILRLLSSAGAGTDIVSGGELFRAKKAHISGDKIVFSGAGKTKTEIEEALSFGKNGIFSFNVESEEELGVLEATAKKLKKTAHASFRFNPDVDPKTHPHISTGLKKNKFGLERVEIIRVVKKYRKSRWIKFRGVSIHIGSQILSLSPFRDAFAKTKNLIAELDRILPYSLECVDVGGGLGITYNHEKAPSIQNYCQLIHEFFGDKSLHIILEPGRVISGNAGILVAKVLYRKTRPGKNFVIVDAGMNDLIRPALYEGKHSIIPVKLRRGPIQKCDVVGPICESTDCFASDYPLPRSLTNGDLVSFLSAGAYGFSMSSQYNSRPRVPEVLVTGDTYKILRKRESYADLLSGESI